MVFQKAWLCHILTEQIHIIHAHTRGGVIYGIIFLVRVYIGGGYEYVSRAFHHCLYSFSLLDSPPIAIYAIFDFIKSLVGHGNLLIMVVLLLTDMGAGQ